MGENLYGAINCNSASAADYNMVRAINCVPPRTLCYTTIANHVMNLMICHIDIVYVSIYSTSNSYMVVQKNEEKKL
jgi:hypothetical protein